MLKVQLIILGHVILKRDIRAGVGEAQLFGKRNGKNPECILIHVILYHI